MKEKKRNCWEYRKCGREPGGKNVAEKCVCPAAIEKRYNGVNNGKKGGRFCWVVAGTYCKGKVQGAYAQKLEDCIRCPFYKEVERQEGRYLRLSPSSLNNQSI
jgi:hypothetical protein